MLKKIKADNINMTNGPLLPAIIRFYVPLVFSSLLQILYNAADIIVIGKYSGKAPLAALGATTNIIALIVNTFVGLAVGVNVAASKFIGAKKDKELYETVQTSMFSSVVIGIVITIIGLFISRPVLELMKTPADVIDLSDTYMKIFFMGSCGSMVYNFGASILRAAGDTKRPMYYLAFSGIINVILNVIFVKEFHMSVDGVAYATIISQYISAVLVTISLAKTKNNYKFHIGKFMISWKRFMMIVKIGLPAGIQSALFSISNIMIQSSINLLGSTVMAASTVSSNIENFVYVSMNAMSQTTISFTSQNVGAEKYDRVWKTSRITLLLVTAIGAVLGLSACAFSEQLIHIYSKDTTILPFAKERLFIVCVTYFTCGILDVLSSAVRGLGYSLAPTAICILGICGLRIVWVKTVFKNYRTLASVMLSYPVSWICSILVLTVVYLLIKKKINSKHKECIT